MNLAHILDGHSDSSVALVSRGRNTTYGTLRQQIASMRGALRRENVGKGDVVALLCGNSRYFVVSYFAAIGVGAIIAPLNPTSPAPELEGELLVIKPTVVVVEPSAVAAWNQIPSVTKSAVRVVIGTEGNSIPDALT
ncbi:MAG: AMP-binding protein, partial [Actinobacteria bacterium]|nr:AMP-binding protein [Actinomycetota bacterium]